MLILGIKGCLMDDEEPVMDRNMKKLFKANFFQVLSLSLGNDRHKIILVSFLSKK